MISTELYDILELPVNSTIEDIKKSYKKKAILLHPDKGGNNEKFQKLNEAYEILSNPEKRKNYDERGMGNIQNDIFSNMFRGFPGFPGFNNQQKCQPIQLPFNVTLNELYCGVHKKIKYSRKKICMNCNGKGSNKVDICNKCNGSGNKILIIQLGPNMIQQQIMPCDECHSSGFIFSNENKCIECQGNKLINVDNIIDVIIIPVMVDKQVITFEDIGDELSNKIKGDVIIIINQVKHELFERRENDLVYKMNISLGEALLGFSKPITLLNNKQVYITSSNSISSHSKWIIKKYGMPFNSQQGNLIIKVIVDFPSILEAHIEVIRSIFPVNVFINVNENDTSNEIINIG